jgi:hypothetical protein
VINYYFIKYFPIKQTEAKIKKQKKKKSTEEGKKARAPFPNPFLVSSPSLFLLSTVLFTPSRI